MLLACKDLQGQKAPQAPREKEVPLVCKEPQGMLEQQDLPDLPVHRELQVPGGPQDSRGTEVFLETEESKVKAGFQTVLL